MFSYAPGAIPPRELTDVTLTCRFRTTDPIGIIEVGIEPSPATVEEFSDLLALALLHLAVHRAGVPCEAPLATEGGSVMPADLVFIAEVSPTFPDITPEHFRCLHCHAPMDPQAIRHDQRGDFIACAACRTRYYARGGIFRHHGDLHQERWCGHCQSWRDAAPMTCACWVCGTDFAAAVEPPEAALMRRLPRST
jgi:uncharacterized CHY-type Zn-finger protein